MIENYFDQVSLVNNIFDPVPSYADLWYFNLENIINNCDKEKWEEFYKNSYKNKLNKLFNNEYIFDIEVGMISKPNHDNMGRCLQYNRYDFFIGIISFLNDEIDNYNLNAEERNKRIEELIQNIGDTSENRNIYFSEMLKEKKRRLKDVLDKEFNSEYFEVAMKDYNVYKRVISFSEYIEKYYKVISDFQMGVLRLGDFFETNIDINKFSEVMNIDKLCLLFAKIIYDINKDNELNDNYRYLCFYKHVLDNILKDDKKYNVSIIYINEFGRKVKYSVKNFIKEYGKLEGKYSEIKNYKLPEVDNHESYKDISLMEKINELHKQSNWIFLNKSERIKKSNNKDINLRINILENSGYIGRPLVNNDNYAFIYENELVIIENFNELEHHATYIMNIDDFIKLSKESNIKIIDFVKEKEIKIKRIFHTNINNWQRNLFDEINGTYLLEDALNFINSIK